MTKQTRNASKFRKLRRIMETPKQRKARKNKEFRMAVIRTAGTIVGMLAAVFSLLINVLIFYKVWMHKG